MTNIIFCRRNLFTLCMMTTIFFFGGCATHARQLVLRYDPVSHAQTRGSELHLINSASQLSPAAGAWELGSTRNPEGVILDTLWSGVSPAALAQSALQRELGQSGYRVIQTQAAPPFADKKVEITEAAVKMEQTSSLTRLNADCTIKLSLTVTKKGAPVRKLHYEAKGSDLAIKDRDRLAEAMLLSCMQDVMRQAIPDIVAILE